MPYFPKEMNPTFELRYVLKVYEFEDNSRNFISQYPCLQQKWISNDETIEEWREIKHLLKQ